MSLARKATPCWITLAMLKLPTKRGKSGIRRLIDCWILGAGKASNYRKGKKGKYQHVESEKRGKTMKAKPREGYR
jgi:hypothetical protein